MKTIKMFGEYRFEISEIVEKNEIRIACQNHERNMDWPSVELVSEWVGEKLYLPEYYWDDTYHLPNRMYRREADRPAPISHTEYLKRNGYERDSRFCERCGKSHDNVWVKKKYLDGRHHPQSYWRGLCNSCASQYKKENGTVYIQPY